MDGESDAIFRRLRLLDARIERLQETTNKAQRRADSAWTANTRLQERINEVQQVAPVPTTTGADLSKLKAGTSLKATLDAYNNQAAGG